MSGNTGQEPTEVTGQEPTEVMGQEPDSQPSVGQEPTPKPTPAGGYESLPDWAQNEIKALRAETAKHRKIKIEAEKEAAKAAEAAAAEQGKFKDLWEQEKAKREEAEQARQAVEQARLRDQVALKHKLPPALADRLRGETEEELEADAKALLEAMPQPTVTTATDAANGSNNSQSTPAMDDRAIQEMAAVYGVSVENIKATLGIQ